MMITWRAVGASGVMVALAGWLAPACSSGGSGACVGGTIDKSCTDTPCGGDIVGTWSLVGSCAPSCVVSAGYPTITYEANGTYRGGGYTGTWTTSGTSVTRKLTTGTGGDSYCVRGDRLWQSHTTNCGAASGPLTTVWQKTCGATPTPTR
jgi:hypothetical protein